MKLALIALLILVAGTLLHFLFLWMEGKGWIYYKRSKPSRTALGNAFLEIQSILEPGKKLIVEVRKAERREPAAAGDGKEKYDEPE